MLKFQCLRYFFHNISDAQTWLLYIHWYYKSNNSGCCPLVQGEHPLQCGLLPGQHRHVFDQSGREGKAGGPGWRAGSSESTEGKLASLLTHSQHFKTLYILIYQLCVRTALVQEQRLKELQRNPTTATTDSSPVSTAGGTINSAPVIDLFSTPSSTNRWGHF